MRNLLYLILFLSLLLSGCKYQTNKQVLTDSDTTSFLLYIGTYTEKEAHVEGKATGIYIFRFDANTGRLSKTGVSPSTTNPSFIDISDDAKYLYAVNETGGPGPDKSGSVSAFRIIEYGTQLEFINKVSSEGDYPCYIEIDPSGKFVLTANYGSGNVALLPVEADGRLKNATYVHNHEGRGPTARQKSAHAHSIVISPDNRFAYSCDLGTDKIYIYRITGSGELEPSGTYEAGSGSGPRHLAFHPNLDVVYSVNELAGTIECIHRDTITGELTRFQKIPTTDDGGGTVAGSADIHITPSGEFLYASNRGAFNNLAVYLVDQETGELRFSYVQSVNGKTPRNFAIDPSGRFLLVANQDSDNVVTFRIDQETGNLVDTGIETNVPTPVCLKFMPQ